MIRNDTVLNETKMVDGVETRVIEDRETKNGQLIELPRDYYAIDSAKNDVYYFGEDVDVYKNGKSQVMEARGCRASTARSSG